MRLLMQFHQGMDFNRLMDEMVMDCSDEQFQVVEDMIAMVRDPDFIIGELPADFAMPEIDSRTW